jgi:hypothetical protein
VNETQIYPHRSKVICCIKNSTQSRAHVGNMYSKQKTTRTVGNTKTKFCSRCRPRSRSAATGAPPRGCGIWVQQCDPEQSAAMLGKHMTANSLRSYSAYACVAKPGSTRTNSWFHTASFLAGRRNKWDLEVTWLSTAKSLVEKRNGISF